jgi:hypothetical protein
LKSKLKTIELDEKGKLIFNVLNELLDGYGSIDEIIVAYYRKYSEELCRKYLANKLYRMVNEGHLFYIKKKKGAYTTKKELVDFFQKHNHESSEVTTEENLVNKNPLDLFSSLL